MSKIAIGVGFNFAIVESEIAKHIQLEKTNLTVKVNSEVYVLHKGTTFEESKKVDKVLDRPDVTEYVIGDFREWNNTHTYSFKKEAETEVEVSYKELSEDEIEQCIERYYIIRETEEERLRDETNNNYDKPMPSKKDVRELLKGCRFFRDKETGYVAVIL